VSNLISDVKGGTWLRVFENRVLRRKFGPKRDEVKEIGENCIMKSFITCSLYQIMIRMFTSRRMRWAGYVA
jgi:hypothetical protein